MTDVDVPTAITTSLTQPADHCSLVR